MWFWDYAWFVQNILDGSLWKFDLKLDDGYTEDVRAHVLLI